MTEKIMWYALSKVPGLEVSYLERILATTGNIETLFRIRKQELRKILEGLRIPERIMEPLLIVREFDYRNEYDAMIQNGVSFIIRSDDDFPKRLRSISEAPYYLYYKGKLPTEDKPALAIIGARNCSVYGQQIAICFSKILAGCGIQIISGMARGIDGYAHKGALEASGYTCAVLGFGMDICYPKEHIGLKREIEQSGCIMTEYAFGIPGLSQNFPARNRLIAGISDAVFVVEAAKRSGTLITADFALEQGKMVYAVPGRIGDRLSEGCNELIRDGGKIINNPEDILSEFNLQLNKTVKKTRNQKNKIVLETQEKIVYACLDFEPRHIEQLVLLTGLPQEELLVCLMRLEMLGVIRQPVKNYYIKNIENADLISK